MADAKSVIEIDVDDAKFKAFAEAFQKYQKTLEASVASMAALGTKGNAALERMATGIDKLNKNLGDTRKNARDATDEFGKMEASTASIAKNFGSIALSIGKWVAFSALGTGFGLNALANTAGGATRQAAGLGISPGELRAARLSFDRFINTESTLAKITEAAQDPSKAPAFSAFGVKTTTGKSAIDLLVEMLPQIKKSFEKTPYLTMQALGAMGIFSFEEQQRLAKSKPEDVEAAIKGFADLSKQLQIDPALGARWQDFQKAMAVAGEKIETSFIKELITLQPALEKFADSMAKYIGSPEFTKDLETFVQLMKAVVEVLRGFVQAFGWLRKSAASAGGPVGIAAKAADWWHQFLEPKETTSTNQTTTQTIQTPTASIANGQSKKEFLQQLSTQYNLPQKLLDAIWQEESGRGRSAGYSSKGALGEFQFIEGTAKQYGITDRRDFYQEATGAAKYLKDLLGTYHGDVIKAASAYHSGAGNVSATDPNWRSRLGPEGKQYGVDVAQMLGLTINNNTGGSAVTSIAQAPGP